MLADSTLGVHSAAWLRRTRPESPAFVWVPENAESDKIYPEAACKGRGWALGVCWALWEEPPGVTTLLPPVGQEGYGVPHGKVS